MTVPIGNAERLGGLGVGEPGHVHRGEHVAEVVGQRGHGGEHLAGGHLLERR